MKSISGSHHIYVHAGSPLRIPRVHGGRDLKRGLQRHLVNQADIDESDL